jgi:hypothetical protein
MHQERCNADLILGGMAMPARETIEIRAVREIAMIAPNDLYLGYKMKPSSIQGLRLLR